MAEKVDLRVRKTHRKIERAFVKLLGEKEFSQITVQNIIDEADVNRKTFYKHYKDKYELVDELAESTRRSFEEALTRRFERAAADPEDAEDAMRAFYLALFDDRETILALLPMGASRHHLFDDFRRIMERSYLERFAGQLESMDGRERNYLASTYSACLLASIVWVLRSDDPASIDVVCDLGFNRSRRPDVTRQASPARK